MKRVHLVHPVTHTGRRILMMLLMDTSPLWLDNGTAAPSVCTVCGVPVGSEEDTQEAWAGSETHGPGIALVIVGN